MCVALKRAVLEPFGFRRLLLLSLLGEQNGLDVGQDATLGDSNFAQQLVQLLVISDGQLQVTRDDSSLLVVAGSVTGQFQDLGSQVFKDGGQVYGCSSANSFRVVPLPQQSMHTTDWKLKTSS